MASSGHQRIETNIGLMVVLILIVASIGGIATVLPLFWQVELGSPSRGWSPMVHSSSPVVTSTYAKAATSVIRR